MLTQHITSELSGAAEPRPVKPACWRNALERFVMEVGHAVVCSPAAYLKSFSAWLAAIGVSTGPGLQKRSRAGWRNAFIKPALLRFYSMFPKP